MAVPDEVKREIERRYREYPRTLDCVHCGLCIPNCPTHGITGREADSPRGRIYLIRGYAEDRIEVTPDVLTHLDQCIVCRSCETVCPSGVRMSEMMESFRWELNRSGNDRSRRRRWTRFFLNRVLPYRERIALATDVLWLFQVTGLRRLVFPLLRRFAPRLAALEKLQPEVPSPRERRIETSTRRRAGCYPARNGSSAEGVVRARVGLFLGCITSEWFAPTHRATIRVLQRNGCDVLVPDAQTCCGALHRHGGFLEEARDLYARNAEAFQRVGVDVVVVNAAGCGAVLKEPPHGMPEGLGVPVRDICEFLDEIGLQPPAGRIEKRVVYDQPCHLLHGQRVGAPVVEGLLRQIPGLELLPLSDSDRCCGSGGLYNLLHPELAEPLLAEKVTAIRRANPDIVVTGNPGCALQIASGFRGSELEVLHPIDLLDRSYQLER